MIKNYCRVKLIMQLDIQLLKEPKGRGKNDAAANSSGTFSVNIIIKGDSAMVLAAPGSALIGFLSWLNRPEL